MTINNRFYTDKNIFDLEKNIIQEESWILVAHKSELQKNNDFLTFNYYDDNIFIQNFNGKVKAFQNICLHRFNRIHESEFGNRVASCLYHNWVYNNEGKVSGLRCRSSFDNEIIEEKKLREYEVDLCGSFIFIKLNDRNSISLKDYLGLIYEKLETFSNHFGTKTIDYNKEHNGNWKLLLENVLECYHCVSVHMNSFAKMGYGFVKPERFNFYQGHSWCEFPKRQDRNENKLVKKVLDSRSLKGEGYFHFYIYPNAFISSVEGKGFYLGLLFPKTYSETTLRVRYFSPIIDSVLSDSDKNILDFINKSSHDSLDLVLNEDKKIIENIQSNLRSVINLSPFFGDEEFRINNFYNFYLPKLKNHERSV
jgi:phenylpropionate dioxygenase-like ring-hydroxylating dioxygenase large terminal subunit